jgi:adenylate cyclase
MSNIFLRMVTGSGRRLRRAFTFDRWIGLAVLAGFLTLYVANPYPVEFLRLKTFDYYQKLKPREIPPPPKQIRDLRDIRVAIADLDEESLNKIGQWPWSRDVVGQMVMNLFKMGALLVAFDIVFPEPDRMNPKSIAEGLAGLDEETRKKLMKLPGNDAAFANVVKRTRVVLGQAAYWDVTEIVAAPPKKKSVALMAPKGIDAMRFVPGFPELIRNIPIIENASAGHGIFSLLPEPDGIVRRVPTFFRNGESLYPALALEMLRVISNRKTLLLKADVAGIKEIGVAPKKFFPPRGLRIETDRQGRVWPYFSKQDHSKYIRAMDILAGTVDPAKVKGKMIIVGTSAVGLLDIRATPVERVIPGVEVHVQLIEALLSNMQLKRPNFIDAAEMTLILLGGLLMIVLVPWVGARWTVLILAIVAGGAGATSWYLFTQHLMLFDAGFAVISILILYTLLTYTGYAKEEKQRREVRNAFAHYLAPAMVEKLAEDPSQLSLGGDQREMTLLFCDVRGFTTISEQFDAVGLTSLINKLLTPLTNVILARQGTVDKYMGDCIMAFWNAPMDDDNHARNGCISALAMLAEMQPLNDRLEIEAKEEGRKHIPLQVGLGLNSGECVVGNMGSDQRFDYSVLGDTVNLAARLEGQSKSYGVDVVIGPSTHDQVSELATIELDFIQVKGKTEGVHIFALLGDEEIAQKEDFRALHDATNEMIAAYRGQDWKRARDFVGTCRGLVSEYRIAGLYDLYETRIDDYEVNPPAADWDGVFIATTK